MFYYGLVNTNALNSFATLWGVIPDDANQTVRSGNAPYRLNPKL